MFSLKDFLLFFFQSLYETLENVFILEGRCYQGCFAPALKEPAPITHTILTFFFSDFILLYLGVNEFLSLPASVEYERISGGRKPE